MLIPVQRLRGVARAAYLEHLIALNARDRRLRFGVPRSSAAIAAYVDRIDFDSEWLFGVHGETLAFDGVAHLALGSGFAELGLSVLPQARGKGIGGALMNRATEFARNRSIAQVEVYCLAENFSMIRLARRIGMRVVVQSADADAHIVLPSATPQSVTGEFIAEGVALFDYTLRMNVETWRRVRIAFAESSTL